MNLKMPNFDAVKRPVTLISIASVLLLALLWWFLWMSPQGAKLSTVNTQIQTLTNQDQILQATLATDRQQSAKVNLYAGYLKMFSAAVPEVPDAGGLTTALATLADSISPALHITSITDDGAVAGTPLGTVPLSLQLTGPRQDCFAFLNDLYNPAKMARLITISSFEPAPSSTATPEDILKPSMQIYNVSLVGTAYFDADIDPGLPGAAAPATTLAPT
jgi:Tfp pilus assembly protein PilO